LARALRIGIDLDNTIAGYDRLFAVAAQQAGWLPALKNATKREVRDRVRALPDGETKWQRLQAQAYGSRMAEAELIDGVAEFLARCRAQGAEAIIVSHKTQYATFDAGRIDMREAAKRWLAARAITLPVHFEATRADKIARIAALGCTHFIDDLEEIFTEPNFPKGIARFLLTADEVVPAPGIRVFRSWHELTSTLFG
jgi:hypothetical protein